MTTIEDIMPKDFVPDGLNHDESQFINDGYYVVRHTNKICFTNHGLISNLLTKYDILLKQVTPQNKEDKLKEINVFISVVQHGFCDKLKEEYLIL